MDLETLLSFKWGLMAPEFTIVITATLLSLIDLFMDNKKSRNILGWIGIAGIVIALVFLTGQIGQEPADILFGTYIFDPFAVVFKFIFLVGTAFVFLLAMNYNPEDKIRHRGEFFYLFMTALLGAMFMASSADLITLFIGLELLSISSYILAGMRKDNLQSNEAAMKYIINGAISTAFILFGFSYIYGITGTTNIFEIGMRTANLASGDLLNLAALAFIISFVGLSFKIAVVPYQMWAPDVYQGSPTPVTAFLSVVSKTAGFVIIIRLFLTAFHSAPGLNADDYNLLWSIKPLIAIIAALTMIVGNTIALRQKNIKRLFAYSSIAHAGYLLVPFLSLSPLWLEGIWFYLVAYLLMNLGMFAILQVVTVKMGSDDISSFSGLYKRAPIAAVMMAIFLLSLAGIPGTAGFIGKLNIFIGALGPITAMGPFPGHIVLVSIMMATTVISYFYYFGVMKQMFMVAPVDENAPAKITLPSGVMVVVALCVIGTILFGIAPNLALDFFYSVMGM
ncbi:NADH-quinone oxidoreductase subunit NuoN [Schinkia azotoformans]|uniref:NADH-quinone oxidoreductase subunit NuoN n=1 Tax=Schinkia azotoformans TaxID=1454 RepID=UPI002DB6722B|nr:NADH-quinone oxidoreductase subunit NuoN [Schinkia azotoformans]MEC1743952.1 NADH-quinone oxidoreductase subunit NuoN [Schinkia azotoformans]